VKYDSIFDVIGHIMVGPSSSHTAGACRIGLVVHQLLDGVPTKATIFLHGSFAATYRGHGTDIAIVAGLLGIPPDDERLRDAFDLAKKIGMKYQIKEIDLGENYHPNTVKIVANTKVISLHEDRMGMLAKITEIITKHRLNIESMRLSRDAKKKLALCYIEVNKIIDDSVLLDLSVIPGMKKVRVLNV